MSPIKAIKPNSIRVVTFAIPCTLLGGMMGYFWGKAYAAYALRETVPIDSSPGAQLAAADTHRFLSDSISWIGAGLGILCVVVLLSALLAAISLPVLWRRAYRKLN
ncbi:MAG: hypothetical protein JWN70_1951 [Planctomycetaceae bacterium]|nr:hypothetical protein [Planctomycetaceae bacterium]